MIASLWLTFAAVAIFFSIAPHPRLMQAAGDFARRLAARKRMAVASVFFAALALGFIPTLLGRRALPQVHDEFSNLFAADTFAHGRLTNPTPPFADHFQVIHVLVRPTFASKFPPGLGLVLAVGELLNLPVLGAFAALALASAAIALALRYWLPPRWAIVGGMLAATNAEFYSWGQNYWGGEVTLVGSALLLAGFGRATRRTPDARAGVLLAAGVSIFAITRPFEGMIVALLTAAVLLAHLLRRGTWREAMKRTAPAALAILLPAMAWCGYYNWRVTGHVTHLPWMEYASQQMTMPTFFGQAPPPAPHFVDDKLRQFHGGNERHEFEFMRDAGYLGRLRLICEETMILCFDQDDRWSPDWLHVPSPLLLMLPLVLIACLWSSGARIGLFFLIALMLIRPALTPWSRQHYLAPAEAGLALAWACGLRELSRRVRWPVGAALVAGLLSAQLVATGGLIHALLLQTVASHEGQAAVIRRLNAEPGKQLAMVSYSPGPQEGYEWVYNAAELDRAKIIFARSLDPESDRALLKFYSDRRPWTLQVNGLRASLSPLPTTGPITAP